MTIRRNSVKETSKRFGFIVVGILIGWGIAHHFVNKMGGEWPDASLFGYLLTFSGTWVATAAASLLLSLFRRNQTRRSD
jgi:hypothetical protein